MGKRNGERHVVERPAVDHIPDPKNDGDSKFARALASGDFHTRDKGIKALTLWLQGKQEVDDLSLKKIWKGVYFCFWHSDKAQVQKDLAVQLASILPQLKEQVAVRFFAMFLHTMQREWSHIDKLRLDKFMMLIRTFFSHLFEMMAQQQWEKDYVGAYTKVIAKNAFYADDALQPVGFSLHVADIYVPELLSVASSTAAAAPLSSPRLRSLLQPLVLALSRTQQPALLSRIRTSVFEALLDEVVEPSEKRPFAGLKPGKLADALFEAGADPAVRSRNRSALYDLSQHFEALAGKKRKRPDGDARPGATAIAAAASDTATQMEVTGAGVGSPARNGSGHRSNGAAAAMHAGAGFGSPVTGGSATRGAGSSPATAAGVTPPVKKKARKSRVGGVIFVPPSAGAAVTPTLSSRSAAATAAPAAAPAAANTSVQVGAPLSPAAIGSAMASAHAGGAVLVAEQPSAKRSKAAKHASASHVASASVAVTPEGPPAANGAATVAVAARPPMSKKKAKAAAAAAVLASGGNVGADAVLVTPPAKNGGGGVGGIIADMHASLSAAVGKVSEKKSLSFNMQRNLVHQIGKPLPAAELRTPPSARPHGSALKKVSHLPVPKSDLPAKRRLSFAGAGTSSETSKSRTPTQQKRPAAADFF